MRDTSTSTTLAAGAISGALSRTIASPFEVAKIVQQTCPDTKKNLAQTLRLLVENDGVKSLYRGNGINMLRVVPNYALNFLIFKQTVPVVSRWTRSKDLANFTAGSVAGSASICAVYPLETVRTYVTVKPDRYPGFLSTSRDIWKRAGVRGFYNGVSISALNMGPYIGINFSVYHGLKRRVEVDTPAANFLYGMAGGATAAFALHPTDLVRNRMHIQKSPLWPDRSYEGLMDSVRNIYSKEGVLGFYKGVLSACLRVGVSFGSMFMISSMIMSQ